MPLPSPLEQAERLGGAEAFTGIELRLPAHPTQLKRARDCVAAAATGFGFDHKTGYELVFAVNEAVTNAIKHGRPDADGTISLSIEADGDALVCTVQDRGPFIPRRSTSETDESGRGFTFMTALTDDFELVLEPGATIVRLRKALPAEPVEQGA